MSFVSGNGGADTVRATLAQPVVVELHDSLGKPVPSVAVRFESIDTAVEGRGTITEAFVGRTNGTTQATLWSDTTDASGHASATVRLGTLATTARVVVRVPSLGYLDTARFAARPGNPVAIRYANRARTVFLTTRYNLGVTSVDAYENVRSADAATYRPTSPIVSVDASGLVTPQEFGYDTVVVTVGSRSESAWARVVPDLMLVGVERESNTALTIMRMRTDGTQVERLAVTECCLPMPSTSASGASVAYTTGSNSVDARVFVVDTSRIPRMLPGVGVDNLRSMAQPRVSVDGVWVYFSGYQFMSSDGVRVGTAVWRIHPDGTGLERLTAGSGTNDEASPAPSYDGRSVLFSNKGDLYVLDLATRSVTSLNLKGISARFSPDGSRIAFLRLENFAWQLWVADADGAKARNITPASPMIGWSAPDWSSDGRWILQTGLGMYPQLIRVADGFLLDLPWILEAPTSWPLRNQ